MRRSSFENMNCSIAKSLEAVGEWWTLLIVRESMRGVRRFEGFIERLGIAPNILTTRLRTLQDHGIFETRKYQDNPERFEYRLTEKGRDLFPVIVALLQWGDRWYAEDGPPVVLQHLACGHAANPHLVCTACGEALDPRATRAIPGPGALTDDASLAKPAAR